MVRDAPRPQETISQEIAHLRLLHLGQIGLPQLLQASVGSTNRAEPCNVPERVHRQQRAKVQDLHCRDCTPSRLRLHAQLALLSLK
jgi:hypothetical protein